MPMRVLVDNGVISHSEFAEPAVEEAFLRVGNTQEVLRVHGLRRKQADPNEDYQKQKEALFTVGRMIRDGKIEAYTYIELQLEDMRGTSRIPEFNALQGVKLRRCDPALDRSRFRQTSEFSEYIVKGGKKDARSGIPLGEANQIAFFKWLCALDKSSIDVLIDSASHIGLSPFEIDSLSFSWSVRDPGAPKTTPMYSTYGQQSAFIWMLFSLWRQHCPIL